MKHILKALSHPLAMSCDVLMTNDFGYIANVSLCIAGTLRRAWRVFWNVKKNRQALPALVLKTTSRNIRHRFAYHRHAVAAVRQVVVTSSSVPSLARWWRCTGKSLRCYRDVSWISENCWWCGRQCFVIWSSGITSGRDRVVTKSR